MSDYKPETVAVVTFELADVGRAETLPGIRWANGWAVVDARGNYELIADRNVTDVRPLVTLDLSRVGNTLDDANGIAQALIFTGVPVAVDIAHMIREQTRPPKPAEPTGLGAVVEDVNGVRWVRTYEHTSINHWQPTRREHDNRAWEHIDAVRVRSGGVQP